MRFAVPVVLALVAGGSTLLTTGCAEVATQREVDGIGDKIDKLAAKMAQQNEVHAYVVEEFRKQLGDLNKQASSDSALLKGLQGSVARLEDEVKTLKAQALAQPAPAPAAGDPGGGREAAKATLSLQDVLEEIEKTLSNLRSGKLREDEALGRLRPFAKDAAPRLFQEIRASITKFDYTKQLERILAKLPPEDLKVPLRESLTQHGVRESAARVAGATKDPGLGKLLEEQAATEDEDFRLVLGDGLVSCRNAAGIPLLVRCLRSDQPATRTIAISSLKRINRGDDLGYRAQVEPEQAAPSIKAWEDWKEKYGKVIFD